MWYWVNDSIMGSVIETEGPLQFTAHVESDNGATLLNRVDLFEDGVNIDSQVLINTAIDYSFSMAVSGGESHYYYIRARQVDGDYAWSSPVWVQHVPSSGAGELEREINHGVELLPNAPNPFFPRTQIRYESRGVLEGPIGITIHDVTGRRVRDLGLVPATAGVHRVGWDGRDDSGRELPSGIYLVRLETAHHLVRSQRIMLTR
jgi:hypothetical protein